MAGEIIRAQLEADIIDATKIADNAIGNEHIGDDAVDSAEIATGAIDADHIAGLANTASTLRDRTPGALTFSLVAADFIANNDISLTVPAGHNILITDVWYVGTVAEGGAATVTLRDTANGAGNAVTSALDMNATAGVLQKTTTVNQAAAAFAAGAVIYANCSTNPGTATGLLVINYIHTT